MVVHIRTKYLNSLRRPIGGKGGNSYVLVSSEGPTGRREASPPTALKDTLVGLTNMPCTQASRIPTMVISSARLSNLDRRSSNSPSTANTTSTRPIAGPT